MSPGSSWTAKDERQYTHVKEGERRRGVSVARAKQIAARTVNRQRRLEGRATSGRYTGTGNPRIRLEDRTVGALRNRAALLRIAGRDGMSKQELVRAIRRRNGAG